MQKHWVKPATPHFERLFSAICQQPNLQTCSLSLRLKKTQILLRTMTLKEEWPVSEETDFYAFWPEKQEM